MSKKFLIILVLSLIFNSNVVFAETWFDDWSNYFESCYNTITEFFAPSENQHENILNHDTLPENIALKWDSLTKNLTDALTLRDKQENLPDSAWFGEDKISNSKKINALLDVALKILVESDAENIRKDAANLKSKIAASKTKLDELRNKKISAPENSYLPLVLTKSKADKKIAELNLEIQNYENSLNAINSKVTDALKKIGLDIQQNQVDILLSSVTGDDLLQNAIVFANVKIVVEKLEELSKNETNTFEITKRYTGMYLVLNDLLIHTQMELIKKIDDDYRPGLNTIIQEAINLQRDALNKSKNKTYTQTQRNLFEKNADSNAMTIKVAKLYLTLLNAQKTGTLESIKALKKNRDLAENTYKTVRSSAELQSLIHSGLILFDTIDALSMPDLKPFENDIIKFEFQEINKRLSKKPL